MSEHPLIALRREGLSFSQMAERLGLTPNTVMSRYYAAVKAQDAPKSVAGAKLSRGQLGNLHRSDGAIATPVTLRKFSWEGQP